MGENEEKSSHLSPPKVEAKEVEEESPVRSVFCLKIKEDIEHFEKTEDCFILDFNPSESPELSNILEEKKLDDAVDLAIVAEKGQVACRDYPHSRHLCLKFPFASTPHDSYCEMCYCYVCDLAAPCTHWTSLLRHCDADGADGWKNLRKTTMELQHLIWGAEH